MKTSGFGRVVLVVALAATGAARFARPAHAAGEEQTLRKMVDLNRRALAAHGAGRHTTARKLLLEAVAAGKTASLDQHDMTARTHIHLGIVTIVGLKQREEGLTHFVQALRIKPAIRLTPKYATPELETDFEHARLVAATPAAAPAAAAPLPAPAPPAAPPASTPKAKESVAPVAQKRERSRPGGEEPDVPVSIPQPLYCPIPLEGPPAREVNLRCLTQPEIQVSKVVAYYRPAAGETYIALPMNRTRKGWFSAVIPAGHVTGRSLQFYFEAKGDDEEVSLRNGKMDSPNVIVLKEGAPPIGVGALAALQSEVDASDAGNERSPLEVHESEAVESGRRAALGRRAAGSFWLGLAAGSGRGWHGRRPLERHPRRQVTTGTSPVGLGQLLPELGWQVGDRLSLSLQTRHQYLPPSGSGDAEATGSPPKTAHAAMLRLQYALYDVGGLELFGSLTAGGGSALRMKVEPARELGLITSDTVVVGPLVGGLGAGLAFHFNDRLLALAEGRVLGAAWNVGFLFEINAGVQVAF
jgi:hypothetical protein